MKVYVLLDRDNNSDYLFEGVFGSREQAQVRMDEIVKNHSSTSETLYIEEYEIESAQ